MYVDGALDESRALLDADEAESPVLPGDNRIESVAVILHVQRQVAGGALERDRYPSRPGVANRVSQRFLRDPIHGQGDHLVRWLRLPVGLKIDVQLLLPLDLGAVPLERGDQADVIQHGGVESV